jgi:heme/copper-type cytochrome/quinol oxidase subunit 2
MLSFLPDILLNLLTFVALSLGVFPGCFLPILVWLLFEIKKKPFYIAISIICVILTIIFFQLYNYAGKQSGYDGIAEYGLAILILWFLIPSIILLTIDIAKVMLNSKSVHK